MRCHDTCCRPEPEIEVLVLSRRWIRATRKPHVCGRCGRTIETGSPAQTIAGLVDGDFWSEYRHSTYCTEEVEECGEPS